MTLISGRVLLGTCAQVIDALLAVDKADVDSNVPGVRIVRKFRTEKRGPPAPTHFHCLQEHVEVGHSQKDERACQGGPQSEQ